MTPTKIVLESFKWMFSDPINFFKNYNRNVFYKKQLLKKNFPIQLPTVDLLDLFNGKFELELNKYTYLENTSTVIDLSILKALAKSITNCNYFEIGSLRGESLFNVSEVAKHSTSLTLSQEQMKKFNFKPALLKSANLFNKEIKNLTVIEDNSLSYDFSKLGKFDLIFIDGDHTYNGVKSDTKNVFNHLIHENSIIVWHDYTYFAETVRHEVLAGILDGIPQSHHKNLYHISNSMVAIYSENLKVKSNMLNFPTVPNKIFKVKVEATPL
ncbi:MAG: class I SAM-dependent methyltransferase [Bacteroidota bacterium]